MLLLTSVSLGGPLVFFVVKCCICCCRDSSADYDADFGEVEEVGRDALVNKGIGKQPERKTGEAERKDGSKRERQRGGTLNRKPKQKIFL